MEPTQFLAAFAELHQQAQERNMEHEQKMQKKSSGKDGPRQGNIGDRSGHKDEAAKQPILNAG